MKKLLFAAFIIIILFSSVFAQETGKTDYEKKLEYRRKKIDIILNTQLVGQTTGYDTRDTTNWAVNISPEGYTYGNTSSTGRRGETIRFERISEWIIIRGGIRELSDIEFLDIVGDRQTSDRVKAVIEDKNRWSLWGTSTFAIGLLSLLAGSITNPTNSSLVVAGSALTVTGFVINAVYGNSPRHYINSDMAQEQADIYNIRLKKQLGLPIDLE